MNAYSESQSSGNQWSQPPAALLYQPFLKETPPPVRRQSVAALDDLENQMAEFAVQHELLLSELRKYYVFPADSSVTEFLTERRTIPQILIEAAPQLKVYFGKDSVFSLRAPVDEAGARTLYSVAMWPGKLNDVRDALLRFDEKWWIERSKTSAGYLIFTYELT